MGLPPVPKLGPVPGMVWIPVAAFVGFMLIVVTPIVTTLPNAYSCDTRDAGYYVNTIDPPKINYTIPNFICPLNRDYYITVGGQGFVIYNGQMPTFTYNGQNLTISTIYNCTDLQVRKQNATRCEIFETTVPGTNVTEPTWAVFGINLPAPTNRPEHFDSCNVQQADSLVMSPTPLAIAENPVVPASICNLTNTLTQVRVKGPSFIRVVNASSGEFQNPKMLLNNATEYLTTLEGCVNKTIAGVKYDLCDTLVFSVIPSDLEVGYYNISVTNPFPFDCSAENIAQVYISGPPSVATLTPTHFCSGDGGVITVSGADFAPDATVTIVSDVDNTVTYQPVSVEIISSSELKATFGALDVPAGFYRVQVNNGAGCASTVATGPRVEVRPLVLVFFVDPPTLYNGVQLQATAFTTGLFRDVAAAWISNSTDFQLDVAFENDTASPNRYKLTVPAGLAAGPWNVHVRSIYGCSAELTGGVTITDTVTMGTLAMEPSYLWTEVDTATTITVTGGNPFEQLPRVYLTSAGSNAARSIESVTYSDSRTLKAVIPKGTPVGDYDLIIVNPNGVVGVAANSVHVLANQPPVVDSIIPPFLDASGTLHLVDIYGNHFNGSITLTGSCSSSTGAIGQLSFTGTTLVSSTQIKTTIDTSALTGANNGLVCIVRVTNGDGSNFLYSAIPTRSSSGNLGYYRSGSSMITPRVGHTAVAIRPTATDKYLVAIGGQTSAAFSAASAINSVERASISVYGNLGSWVNSTTDYLPENITEGFAVTVQNFVYQIGGNNGSQALNKVYRAEVLNPLLVPSVDVSINVVNYNNSFTKGLYFYTVAAVFPADDAINPGGESLPAPAIPVQLPAFNRLEVVISWQPFTRASAYRVYRTPAAGASVSTLQFLAEVSASSPLQFSDNGTIATMPSKLPLVTGNLGRWALMNETLVTPRQAHTVQTHAVNGSSLVYVWAFTGHNSGGALNTYEYMILDVSTYPHTVNTTWTSAILQDGTVDPLNPTNLVGRTYMGSNMLRSEEVSLFPAGSQYLFLIGGATSVAAGSAGVKSTFHVRVFDDTPVLGVLRPWDDLKSTDIRFCTTLGAGFMVAFGGSSTINGAGSNAAITADVTAYTSSTDTPVGGAQSWGPSPNSGSPVVMYVAKSPACLRESALTWIIGGATTSTSVNGNVLSVP